MTDGTEHDKPEGFALCDCGAIIFFGDCRRCGTTEDELTFHSAGDSDE